MRSEQEVREEMKRVEATLDASRPTAAPTLYARLEALRWVVGDPDPFEVE